MSVRERERWLTEDFMDYFNQGLGQGWTSTWSWRKRLCRDSLEERWGGGQRCVLKNSCGSLDLDPLTAVEGRLFRQSPSKKPTKHAKHLKGKKEKENLPMAVCCSLFNQHHLELRKRTLHGRKENLFQNAHLNHAHCMMLSSSYVGSKHL